MSVIDNKPLTEQDRTALDRLDGMVTDRLASARTNTWVYIKIAKTTRAKIIAVLKQRMEVRGRQVGWSDESDHWRLTFPPPVAAMPPVAVLSPPVPVAGVVGPRVLIRMPTRGRPAQALQTFVAYRNLAGYPVTIEVVVDQDDEKTLASEVLQRLVALDAVITVGAHRSKVGAVNGGRVMDWDILVLASDDMVPVADGYAKIIVEEMEKHFPHFDGAIYFADGYANEKVVTLPIIGRRLYDQFGVVYSRAYRSLYCDMEQTELLRDMRRLVYVDKMIIEHRHPAAQKAPFDALYDQNESLKSEDRRVYERRRSIQRPHAQFGFDAPPLALSVCIATLPERRRQLDRLVAYIYGQIVRDAPRQVEVVVDSGLGEIGAKRQRLIERALGHYVAHIDDDDWINFDYVKRIVDAIVSSDYAADCLSLWGMITENGGVGEKFHHSIQYKDWYRANNGMYRRSPNHLNPVRRDLALKAGFPVAVSHGEDHEFSKRLLLFLSREVSLDGGPLYHYWHKSK